MFLQTWGFPQVSYLAPLCRYFSSQASLRTRSKMHTIRLEQNRLSWSRKTRFRPSLCGCHQWHLVVSSESATTVLSLSFQYKLKIKDSDSGRCFNLAHKLVSGMRGVTSCLSLEKNQSNHGNQHPRRALRSHLSTLILLEEPMQTCTETSSDPPENLDAI